MAILAMSVHGRDAHATPCGMAILAMSHAPYGASVSGGQQSSFCKRCQNALAQTLLGVPQEARRNFLAADFEQQGKCFKLKWSHLIP